MGLFNKLFGEKVEVNYTDKNGTNRKKKSQNQISISGKQKGK